MAKESEIEWIYVSAQLNRFVVHLKVTQHCKSTILKCKVKIKNCLNIKATPTN